MGIYPHICPIRAYMPDSRLPPGEVLALAERVKSSQFANTKCSLDLPLTSATISLVESGGVKNAYRYEAHLNEGSAGLCQMLLSTAMWLANDMGYTAHGRVITVRLTFNATRGRVREALHEPRIDVDWGVNWGVNWGPQEDLLYQPEVALYFAQAYVFWLSSEYAIETHPL
jgi:hypothetical protein